MSYQYKEPEEERYAIGLMSGTSADGIDAVLISISGYSTNTKYKQIAYISEPYSKELQEHILFIASGQSGGSEEICKLNFLLGDLFARQCVTLCEKAGIAREKIAVIGSHGQTIWHQPVKEMYFGHNISSTLQIGEPSMIAEEFPNAFVVSDFRVRDIAAGGLGAPLVPYTEYLLYRDDKRCIGLQNIGGVGNITILPPGGTLSDVTGFDTGPGNMLIDAMVAAYTGGALHYDKDGKMAASGKVSEKMMLWLLKDPYIDLRPPKNTGREYYGERYARRIFDYSCKHSISKEDVVATVTLYTAKTIEISINRYCRHKPERLIIGGGGSYNPTLMNDIRQCLPTIEVMTNEDIGLDSDSKEAVAFAILANEAVYGIANNAPSATGAKHPVVMGKITRC